VSLDNADAVIDALSAAFNAECRYCDEPLAAAGFSQRKSVAGR
jgi:hypothetical protein